MNPTYNGSPQSATATTTPADLNVTFTYNGSATPPTTAGSYPVVATVNDTNYQGTANGTLVIGKATATVTLGNLAVTYNGSPQSATATTTPASLNVTFTYNGSSTPPTAAGSYAVVATVNDLNYQGMANGTLVISPASTGTNFSAWAASYSFTGGPTDIPENDGVPALLKYLFDINPTVPMSAADREALPVEGITTFQGTDYLTLTFRQYSQLSQVIVYVQTSSDLKTWTTVSPPDIYRQVGTDQITGDPIMQIGVRANGTNLQFVRIGLSQP